MPDLSPLTELHDEWGARWSAAPDGMRVVRDYGDPAAERKAVTGGCGLFELTHLDYLFLFGADRQRFLHGLTTCDIKSLEPGEGVYGFFTDSKGKVLADVVVLAFERQLRLGLPHGKAPSLLQHLEKYIITDRVQIESRVGALAISLLGPAARSLLEEWLGTGLPGKAWGQAVLALEGIPLTVMHNGRAWCGGFTVWLPLEHAEELIRSLVDRRGEVMPVGWNAFDSLRLEQGVPRFGVDFGPDCFPQETGLEEEAVRYEKGCYLGQEIVARIHYRGQANRVMTRVGIEAGEMPAVGAPLSESGREAGRLGTVVATDPGDDTFRAFALIHRRASEPGTSLSLLDGRTATVIDALSR